MKNKTPDKRHKEEPFDESGESREEAAKEEIKSSQQEDFPGYPHYPPEEDITNTANKTRKEPLRGENVTRSGEPSGAGKDGGQAAGNPDTPNEKAVADMTEGLETGDDLDVPGSELDDAAEDIGEEDEENNYYSLGGDRQENLEEDRP